MTLRDQQFDRFHALATGTLRLDPETASAFATHLANACAGLHVIGQLCTAPNALQSSTLASMLERWFRLLPEFAAAKQILERKPGPAQPAPNLDAASALLLHARILEVCLSQRALPEHQALQVAKLVSEAGSGCFRFGRFFRLTVAHRLPAKFHSQSPPGRRQALPRRLATQTKCDRRESGDAGH